MVIFDPKMTQKSYFFAEKCRKSITNLNNARSQRPELVSDQGFTSMAREARRRTGQLDAGVQLGGSAPQTPGGPRAQGPSPARAPFQASGASLRSGIDVHGARSAPADRPA